VETALVLPIFLLLMMTLLDFGRVIFAYNTITQDAREAVRLGMVSAAKLKTADFPARFQAIRDAAKVMSPAVSLGNTDIFGGGGACNAASGSPAMPNDGTDPKTKFYCFYPNGVVNTNTATPAKVVVQIKVRVNFLTPIVGNILGGGVDVAAQSEALIQS
jgi:Flp pilus assembly protein TadG